MKSVQLLYLKTCSVANFDDIFNFEMENGIFEKQAKRMEKNAISCFFFSIFNSQICSRVGNTGVATLLRDLLVYYAV